MAAGGKENGGKKKEVSRQKPLINKCKARIPMRLGKEGTRTCTGLKLFIGSKVLCVFCFEIGTAEGRGGEKGRNANFKQSMQSL